MAEVGTFPFGWVRGFKDDNWQIIWDPATKAVFARGAVTKEVVELGTSSSWDGAKVLADNVISSPGEYFPELSDRTG